MKFKSLIIFLLTAFVSALPAQNVLPSIADPESVASVQREKEEVFKQLFKDPTNLSLLFKYANLSILVGDLEAAIGVFEQMLIYDSELPRIRLELGVLYFRLGAYAMASNYLKSVKEFNPPPEVEAKVNQFLEAIVSAEKPFQWQQNLSIGFKRTTNGNSGINADFIEIGDFLLNVDPESKRQRDRSSLFNYSLSIDQDLNHPRGDNIQYFFSYGADRRQNAITSPNSASRSRRVTYRSANGNKRALSTGAWVAPRPSRTSAPQLSSTGPTSGLSPRPSLLAHNAWLHPNLPAVRCGQTRSPRLAPPHTPRRAPWSPQ